MNSSPEMERPRRVSAEAAGSPTLRESISDARVPGNAGAVNSISVILSRVAADSALAHLDAYARATDAPDWRIVDAADLLEAARDLLTASARGNS